MTWPVLVTLALVYVAGMMVIDVTVRIYKRMRKGEK